MDTITPPLEHQGKTYSGRYQVIGEEVVVFHHRATKRATLHGLQPGPLARQLLFELVALEGKGIPDHQETPTS